MGRLVGFSLVYKNGLIITSLLSSPPPVVQAFSVPSSSDHFPQNLTATLASENFSRCGIPLPPCTWTGSRTITPTKLEARATQYLQC